MKKMIALGVGAVLFVSLLVFVIGSSNPETPAGYVGYLTRGALFGKTQFYGLQTGPTSSGLGWMLSAMRGTDLEIMAGCRCTPFFLFQAIERRAITEWERRSTTAQQSVWEVLKHRGVYV